MAAQSNNGDGRIITAQVLRTRWRYVVGWILVGVGVLLLVLGWFGVSGEPELARQFSYLASGGLGGLAAVIVGVGLLISEDLRSERRRLGRIEAAVLDVNELLMADGRKSTKAAPSRGRRGKA